jgi:hypothetical protein
MYENLLFVFQLRVMYEKYSDIEQQSQRLQISARKVEILDHITSTNDKKQWKLLAWNTRDKIPDKLNMVSAKKKKKDKNKRDLPLQAPQKLILDMKEKFLLGSAFSTVF